MKIAVLGWYDHDNVGDEAYKDAFRLLLPGHSLFFADTLPINVQADAVILGGGDILYTDLANQLAVTDLPKYALSVSVGDSVPAIAFKRIISRDNHSAPYCEWLPDFTFVMQPNPVRGFELIRKQFAQAKSQFYERVGVIVLNANLMISERSLARDAATLDKIAYDLANLADNTPVSFLFLSFGNGFPHNDRITNSMVYSRCKWWAKNVIVFDKLSPQDTLDIIAAADFTISTRLHSTIFSCIGGTPFVDLTHHDKNRNFLKSINKGEWSVDYWRCCAERVKELVNQFLSPNPFRQELLDLSQDYRALLTKAPIL